MFRKTLIGMAAALALGAGSADALAQGTAFTYQGQLKNSGAVVNSATDVQFSLWTLASGGSQIGSTVTNLAVSVSSGLFTSAVDFGVNPYTSSQNLYLQIAVRIPAGSGSYVPMTSRQLLTPAPFSLATRGISVDASGNVGMATSIAGSFLGGTTLQVDRPPYAGGKVLLLNNPVNTWDSGTSFDNYRYITTGSIATDGIWKQFNVGAGGVSIGYSNTPTYGSADALYVNGNVGIGTTTPVADQRLTLINNVAGAGVATIGNDAARSFGGVYFSQAGAVQGWVGATGGGDWCGGNSMQLASTATTDLVFLTGCPERMRISAATGNVGIGTPTPASRLSVAGGVDANTAVLVDSGVTAPQYSSIAFSDRGNRMWSCGLRSDGMFGIDRDGINTFLQIDQLGRLGLGGAAPAAGRQINVQGGAFCTGSVWTNACDKNLKEDFKDVNPEEILAKVADLPISTWRYKGNDKLHVGPTAQDFRAAFGLGENDTSIGTVDADGVSLAAIKGLNSKLAAKDTEVADLKSRLEKIEALLATQAAK